MDYLSDRGLGWGRTSITIAIRFSAIAGRTYGFVDAWGINDTGFDNLGLDRRMLAPETDQRGRILGRHRQFAHGLEFTGELGWISDRNFLEQYYEQEWDQEKDQTTGWKSNAARTTIRSPGPPMSASTTSLRRPIGFEAITSGSRNRC